MNKEYKGYVQTFLGGVIWGTIGLFVMLLEQRGSNAVFSSFLRTFFAFFIMAGVTIFLYGAKSLRVDRKTVAACAVSGMICQGFNCLIYNLAVVEGGVAISSILLNIAPAFTAIFSYFIFAEKITSRKKVAMFINIVGCAIAVTGGSFSSLSFSALGIFYGVLAGFTYALMPILGRIAGAKCNAFVMCTYNYLFASIFLIIFTRPWQYASIVTAELIFFGFLYALIPTAIGYTLYYLGVRNVKETSRIPILASIESVVAILIGVVLFDEPIGMKNLLGMAMVMGSIILMNYKKK